MFRWQQQTWDTIQTLTSPTGQLDGFGQSLSAVDNTVVIGTPSRSVAGVIQAGGVVVFVRATATSSYALDAVLDPPSPAPFAAFGYSVAALNEAYLAVASQFGGPRVGGDTVFLFRRSVVATTAGGFATSWALEQSLHSGSSAPAAYFGASMSALVLPASHGSGTQFVVGAPSTLAYNGFLFDDPTGAPGQAAVFQSVLPFDDFTGYPVGASLAANAARNTSSLWADVSGGTVVTPATTLAAGACTLDATALAFDGGSASWAETRPLLLPYGGSVTVWLALCGPASTAPLATLSLPNGTVITQLRLNVSVTEIEVRACCVSCAKVRLSANRGTRCRRSPPTVPRSPSPARRPRHPSPSTL